MNDTPTRPRVLIEDWLPIKELGIESRREAAPIPGQFPKLKTLHVWWARRPLAAAAGTILTSVLPTWTEELAGTFQDPRTATEATYRKWTLHLCGVWGDPVTAKKAQEAAIESGTRVPNPYSYKQAFKNSPSPADLVLLHRILERTWGELPKVTDPTAGGGTIPYEAARYGLPVIANDLNGVAAAILRAGVEVTARYDIDLKPHLEKWGDELVQSCTSRLNPYFPSGKGETVATFLFARTVTCPRTGKPTPLSPNWWLCKERGKEWAVEVITHRDGIELSVAEFDVRRGRDAIDSNPDKGTVAGGDGISVWDSLPIDGDYIKAEAQAHRMGSVLYTVVVRYPPPPGRRTGATRGFRAPTAIDLEALAAAEAETARLLPSWLANGVVPNEELPSGNKTSEPIRYGITRWIDMFSPRQLLVHATFVEQFHRILPEITADLGEEKGAAVAALLALMQGKALNYNSRMSVWHPSRLSMANTFDQHNFAIKLSHGEFEGQELMPWCLSQLLDAYEELASLYHPKSVSYNIASGIVIPAGSMSDLNHPIPGKISVSRGAAAVLDVESASQALVCIDPEVVPRGVDFLR